jgi:hypothetical protein
MEALNMWWSFARRLSYPSSKSKSSFRPIGTPSMYTFTNNVRRRRAEAVKALLRKGLIGGQSGSTWFLPIIRSVRVESVVNKCRWRTQGNQLDGEYCWDINQGAVYFRDMITTEQIWKLLWRYQWSIMATMILLEILKCLAQWKSDSFIAPLCLYFVVVWSSIIFWAVWPCNEVDWKLK